MVTISDFRDQLILSHEGVDRPVPVATGDIVTFRIRQIHRERTGMHGFVAIILNDRVLEYDNFNLTRSEPRAALVRKFHKRLSTLQEEAYPIESMQVDCMETLLWISNSWEEQSVEIEYVDYNAIVPDKRFPVLPYAIQGGGTIIFGPPGAGKSYALLSMAVSIATGNRSIWKVEERPVVFINLERGSEGVERRERHIANAMGITTPKVGYIHGRGKSLSAVLKRVRTWQEYHQGEGVVILDSVSRAGLGPLTDEQTASRFIDAMNSLGTWIAIGHTPRSDSSHQFGSVHFDAGEDIGIKLSSERRDQTLGMSLTVTKANDISIPPPLYLAFDFEPEREDGRMGELVGIRRSSVVEFPELMPDRKQTRESQLLEFVAETKESTQSQIVTATGLDPSFVFRQLHESGLYTEARRDGRNVYFKIKEGDYDNHTV